MLLARVEGNIVATRKHPSYDAWRLVICQPIGNGGEPEGAPVIAIDSHGAGMHQQVVISSDGKAARKAVGVGHFAPTSAAAPETGGTLGGIAMLAASDDGGPWVQRFTGGALCARSVNGALASQ